MFFLLQIKNVMEIKASKNKMIFQSGYKSNATEHASKKSTDHTHNLLAI